MKSFTFKMPKELHKWLDIHSATIEKDMGVILVTLLENYKNDYEKMKIEDNGNG